MKKNKLIDSVLNNNHIYLKQRLQKNKSCADCNIGINNRTILYNAIDNNNFKTVKQLIDYDSDVNYIDDLGMNPLHYAITSFDKSKSISDRTRIINYLLENGSNPFLKDDSGNTPIDYAKLLQKGGNECFYNVCKGHLNFNNIKHGRSIKSKSYARFCDDCEVKQKKALCDSKKCGYRKCNI
jgi:hypothetical protein